MGQLMAWVSYAQNFEDVMLMRALRHVENGVYIDVGAQGPEQGSITKAFYDRGWSGINIEPVPQYFELLLAARPRDINIQCFVGAVPGSREFFEVADTGLSTGIESLAARYSDRDVHRRTVAQTNLDAICREHGVRTVHFLKIDVEGAENEVIEGFSFTQVRPWILVIEATVPNTSQSSHAAWEPAVLSHEYELVWDDGINRFYLAAEHRDLTHAFEKPPNYFDGFILEAVAKAQDEERRLHLIVNNLQRHVDGLQHHVDALQQQVDALKRHEVSLSAQVTALQSSAAHYRSLAESAEAQLASVYASTSWRITRSLRSTATFLRRFSRRETVEHHVASANPASETDVQIPEHAVWVYRHLKRP
jgi:FkbM family methyltransferase